MIYQTTEVLSDWIMRCDVQRTSAQWETTTLTVLNLRLLMGKVNSIGNQLPEILVNRSTVLGKTLGDVWKPTNLLFPVSLSTGWLDKPSDVVRTS